MSPDYLPCGGPGQPCAAVGPSTSSATAACSHTCNIHDHQRPAGGSKEYLVRASYLEIYNEDIRDLLSKNPQTKLELKESTDKGVYVKDLMQFVVKSVQEINSVLQVG